MTFFLDFLSIFPLKLTQPLMVGLTTGPGMSLYINNEYGMYMTALDWVKESLWNNEAVSYDVFRHTLTELFGDKTPDGVSWDDDTLDHEELSEMLLELVD